MLLHDRQTNPQNRLFVIIYMVATMIDIRTTEGKTVVLEREGDITFCVVRNDGHDQNNYLLIGLKMIVSSQLPRMPKEYIVRLVFDQ